MSLVQPWGGPMAAAPYFPPPVAPRAIAPLRRPAVPVARAVVVPPPDALGIRAPEPTIPVPPPDQLGIGLR